MPSSDPRRAIPRTDALLAEPELQRLAQRLGTEKVKAAVVAAQDLARAGGIEPGAVRDHALARMRARERCATTLTSVLNATGVVVHTNLGRAPLTPAAQQAVAEASAYVDVELDLHTGVRARRGRGALAALLEAVPAAEDALVVNNGAAAMALAAVTLAQGAEVVMSRGELIEIGDGFRLPELVESTGTRIREVGTTNRTHAADYERALSSGEGEGVGAVFKIHPSNYVVSGFTTSVSVAECAKVTRAHGVPLVVDIGSGLLAPDAVLPDEPDAQSALQDGADLVTSSGDKLLGGPQAGIVLGRHELVERLRRHPMARAFRTDKLTLAALEATLRGPRPAVLDYLHADAAELRSRATALASAVGSGEVVPVDGAVGGGGGAGVPLPGFAVALPEGVAGRLRLGRPAVLARVEGGRTLVDLRCVPPERDGDVAAAVRAALAEAAMDEAERSRGAGERG